jgi:hypothetical protein
MQSSAGTAGRDCAVRTVRSCGINHAKIPKPANGLVLRSSQSTPAEIAFQLASAAEIAESGDTQRIPSANSGT